MVTLNYHEMTMSESRDSPARQKQFLVICTVMAAVLAYTCMTSGALESVQPIEGVFPGGNFVYKSINRDYAASMGLGRQVSRDLIGEKTTEKQRFAVDEMSYHLYLDDPWLMGGRRQRFMSGIMGGNNKKDEIKKLRSLNKENSLRSATDEEKRTLSAREIFEMVPYEFADLPSVDSLVLQFPFTNGFVSALMLSYRILPTLRKMAKQQGNDSPVVISNCSREQQMCTHYAPLVQGKQFLLGRPDTDTYLAELGPEPMFDVKGMKNMVKKVIFFMND